MNIVVSCGFGRWFTMILMILVKKMRKSGGKGWLNALTCATSQDARYLA